MRKAILVFLVGVLMAPLIFWAYGNYTISTGKSNALWLLEDMWGGRYFGLRSGEIQVYEKVYLESLIAGSSKNQYLIDYIVKNKCYSSSWRCSVVMTAASNLMLDNDQARVGLRGAIEAHERMHGGCSILLESTVVSYHLRSLSVGRDIDRASKARVLLARIKNDGGVLVDVRSSVCRELVSKKPEYFTAYALLVARLMAFSGGEAAYAAAYIGSLEK